MSTKSQLEDADDTLGDFWRDIREYSKKKRAKNRDSSPTLLKQHGIAFVSKNLEAHLIITHGSETINFWPGTGLWMVQGSKKRHGGVFKLIAYVTGRAEKDVRILQPAPEPAQSAGSGSNFIGSRSGGDSSSDDWDSEAPFGLGQLPYPPSARLETSDREPGSPPDGESAES